jgi:hypothetical protein
MLLLMFLPWKPAAQTGTFQTLVTSAKPADIFDDTKITDPRKIRRAKVQTIGSMPVIIGITELK